MLDGSSNLNQTQLTQFLTDGAKEVLNTLPINIQRKYGTTNTLNNSSTTLTLVQAKYYLLQGMMALYNNLQGK